MVHCSSDTEKDQWQKKKQTKAERRAAKLAKLNPDNHPSALDVMKEKELKRKREIDGDEDDPSGKEQPREGMKQKKQKLDHADNGAPAGSKDETEQTPLKKSKAEKRKAQEQHKEKLARKEEKRKAKRARREAAEREAEQNEAEETPLPPLEHHDTFVDSVAEDFEPFDASDLADGGLGPQALSPLDIPKFTNEPAHQFPTSASPSPPPDSTFSHVSKVSTCSASSVPSLTTASTVLTFPSPRQESHHHTSSEKSKFDESPDQPVNKRSQNGSHDFQPSSSDQNTNNLDPTHTFSNQQAPTSDNPSAAEQPEAKEAGTDTMPSESKSKAETKSAEPVKESKEVLHKRLHDKITAFRAARKADGPDGRPAKNRAELIEARRQEQAKRKQHKKELRKLSKEEEARVKEEEARAKAEAELRFMRGSGSPIGSPGEVFSRRSSPDPASLNFGRVAWGDGTHLDKAGSTLNPAHKRKGPSDPRTALEVAEKKRERLAGLDGEKRADIEEKDAWLNAKKKVHGERVRDDESLLKKALKRKDDKKKKSTKQWLDRLKGVERAKEAKQKKREENLKARQEEKGVKKKKLKRPGFEGSFRARPKMVTK